MLSTWKCPSIKLGARYAPLEIDDFFRFVIAKADDAAVVDRDIRFVNLAAEDVDELRVFEKQLRRLFAARDAEFVLQISLTDKTCSAVACSGRRFARMRRRTRRRP